MPPVYSWLSRQSRNLPKYYLNHAMYVCVCVHVHTHISHSVLWDTMDCSLQGFSVHGNFLGAGSLSLLQGELPDPGIEPESPALQADSLPSEPPGKWKWKSLSCVWLFASHRLYSLWNSPGSPGQNIGVGSLSILQGIFPTQGSNPVLPSCRWILYQLNHKDALCNANNIANANIITSPNSILEEGTNHYATFA